MSKIKIRKRILSEACLMGDNAYENKTHVFAEKREKFLPQWNIPRDLEYKIPRTNPKNEKDSAGYLFVLGSLERMSLTKTNIRNGLRAWEDPKTRWIFNPIKVANAPIESVEHVCKKYLQYTLNNFPKNYKNNCIKISSEYAGDPRNIINERSFRDARKRLMEFHGIREGISNLIILYYHDRKLAKVTDPNNCRIKVDIHKSRIPLNIGAIEIPREGIREGDLVEPLENMYFKISQELNLSSLILDPALWIIGSKVCAKRDYSLCISECPIENLCKTFIPKDKETSKFFTPKKDLRKNGDQMYFDFHKNGFIR